MPTNDYKAFAIGGGANVITQIVYAAASYISTGRLSGILPSNIYNKIARQSSIAAYLCGQLIVDQVGTDALDDGDVATLLANFKLAVQKTPTAATRTVLTSGTAATYTTPTNARQLRIRMMGASGGGSGVGGSASPGVNGTASLFNAIAAAFGVGGAVNVAGGLQNGGAGGTGGTGSASVRIKGGDGCNGSGLSITGANFNQGGAAGGHGVLGNGGNGANTTTAASNSEGSGGGAGEYVELIINNPAPTYVYTVGIGGAAGTTAKAGDNGIIIVDELY